MEVELRLFATFREVVGQKLLMREYDDECTVGDILTDLSSEYPDLDFFTDEGELRQYLSIMRNGRDIAFLDGLDTEVQGGDAISLFPPVAGGSETQKTRQFRGISERAALAYLQGLGGEQTGASTVEGNGWRASVRSELASVGPTLELTEVTIHFEGTEDRVETVVDQFVQKAMRAGG